MPRETIRTDKGTVDVEGGHVPGFDIKVGWNKDQYMQVGIEESCGISLIRTFSRNPNCEPLLGAMIREIIVPKPGSALYNAPDLTDAEIGAEVINILETVIGGFPGIWTDMNRHDVNELIRLLRKARDSAFGRDE